MTEVQVHRLALAVRSAVGIESLVWLVDVGGVTRDDAAGIMLSSARALLHQAVADADHGR